MGKGEREREGSEGRAKNDRKIKTGTNEDYHNHEPKKKVEGREGEYQ